MNITMANVSTSKKRKRGRAADKLCVRLFLLDPEKETTKVTKEIGSEKGQNELKEKGCGPPRPEHCISGEAVEFSFDLTNEQFKQKIVEIYPILENGVFVFMIAGKDNILNEINPGRCCYRCYTPENVYHSERGQGRLYIRKIAESQISPCNHGISMRQKFGYQPIRPKPPSATSTSGPSAIVISEGETSQSRSTVSTQLIPSTIGGIGSTPPPQTQNLLSSFNTIPIVSQMGSTPPAYNSVNILPQSQLSSVINDSVSRPPVFSTNAMTTSGPLLSGVLGSSPTPSMVAPVKMATLTSPILVSNTNTIRLGPSLTPEVPGITPTLSMVPPVTWPTLLPPSSSTVVNSSTMTTPGLSLPSSSLWALPQTSGTQTVTMSTQSVSRPMSKSPLDFSSITGPAQDSSIVPRNNIDMSSSVFPADVNAGESSTTRESEVSGIDVLQALLMLESSGQNILPALQQTAMSDTRSWSNPHVEENMNLIQRQSNIDAVLKNIESTGKLEISLTFLNDDHLLKKLKESTINIHTVEIQSKCKLEEVLQKYSLPPCVKLLSITDNNLDYDDVFTLVRSSGSLKNLHELDFSCTKFIGSSFVGLLSAFLNCSDIQRVCLTNNGLTEEDRNCLTTAFHFIKNLKNLNISKNYLTEAQANDILQKNEGKTIVSLDLSQNALQGDEIITNICKLKSLEELNLSHNHIRFPQLRSSAEESENFLTNTKIISMSSNHMTSDDIYLFPSFIRSDLVNINLDSNHVGCSILTLRSLRIKHLKVLSLANADICGSAVQGLAIVLSSAKELEELNLSSNNLMSDDFQQLVSPLSSLTKLKKLNVNNNPDGVSVVLEKILPHMKCLEELRLSNTHLSGDDFIKFFESLRFLNEFKFLDLSNNAIGPSAVKTLSDILKELRLLEGLDLGQCRIREEEISDLCGFIPLNKLKYLNLSGNSIDGDRIFFDSLFSHSTLEEVILGDIIHGGKLFNSMILLKDQLRKLHLGAMKLRPLDIKALAAMLSSFLNLEELVLTDIHVVDGNCEEIFKAIGKMKKIRKLVLPSAWVDDEEAFFDMLSHLSVLEEIVFPRVEIDDSFSGCFNVLPTLVYLKSLDLSQTRVDYAAVADVLPSLKLLERLLLNECKFDAKSQRQLFHAVGKLKYLKELKIEYCFSEFFTELGVMVLAEVLPSLYLLEKLELPVTECDYEVNTQLIRAVGELKYLTKLNLYFYQTTATELLTLAQALKSLQLLEVLKLRDCRRVSGFDYYSETQMLHAVGKLKYLKKLRFCYTATTKTYLIVFPDVLQSLQLLEDLVLDLYNCDDGSKLFATVGKLKYLKKLTLWEFEGTQQHHIALAEVLPTLQLLEKLHLHKKGDENDDQSETKLFQAIGKLKYLKDLALCYFCLTQTDAVVSLSEVLASLQLLERFEWGGETIYDGCAVFDAVGKLKYLKELDLGDIAITKAAAETLNNLLQTSRSLRTFRLPRLIEGDRDDALINNLKATACGIPRLEVF